MSYKPQSIRDHSPEIWVEKAIEAEKWSDFILADKYLRWAAMLEKELQQLKGMEA